MTRRAELDAYARPYAPGSAGTAADGYRRPDRAPVPQPRTSSETDTSETRKR